MVHVESYSQYSNQYSQFKQWSLHPKYLWQFFRLYFVGHVPARIIVNIVVHVQTAHLYLVSYTSMIPQYHINDIRIFRESIRKSVILGRKHMDSSTPSNLQLLIVILDDVVFLFQNIRFLRLIVTSKSVHTLAKRFIIIITNNTSFYSGPIVIKEMFAKKQDNIQLLKYKIFIKDLQMFLSIRIV